MDRELEKWKIKTRERDPKILFWMWVVVLDFSCKSHTFSSLNKSARQDKTIVYNFLDTNERWKKILKIGGRFSTNERKTCGLKNLNLIALPKKWWGLEKKLKIMLGHMCFTC